MTNCSNMGQNPPGSAPAVIRGQSAVYPRSPRGHPRSIRGLPAVYFFKVFGRNGRLGSIAPWNEQSAASWHRLCEIWWKPVVLVGNSWNCIRRHGFLWFFEISYEIIGLTYILEWLWWNRCFYEIFKDLSENLVGHGCLERSNRLFEDSSWFSLVQGKIKDHMHVKSQRYVCIFMYLHILCTYPCHPNLSTRKGCRASVGLCFDKLKGHPLAWSHGLWRTTGRGPGAMR